MARKIYDIDIDEITLCKSPANKKKFFIKKSEEKPMEFMEALKKFVAESDEDTEEALSKEQIAKAEKLSTEAQKEMKEALEIIAQYEDVPDEWEKALKILVGKAAFDYPEIEEEIGKAGAKLSKTTRAQIAEALGHIKDGPKAVAILKGLLGQKVEETEKGGEGEENLSAETIAKLERLEEFEKKEKEELAKENQKKQDERTLELISKALKDAGLDEPARKTSIDGQEGDEGEKKDKKKGAGDEEEDKFPSIPIPDLGGG